MSRKNLPLQRDLEHENSEIQIASYYCELSELLLNI